MKNPQNVRYSILLFSLIVLGSGLLLIGCTGELSSALETQVADVGKTAVAEGSKLAATQLSYAKETAVALAATEAAQLKETVAAALPINNPTNPNEVNLEVQAARLLLKTMSAMKSPWGQVDAPIKSNPSQRSNSNYANVIDQFEVDASEFADRYQAGGSGVADTRCNIFAGDVMRAMGVALPTKGNLGKGQGSTNATYSDPMTAQAVLLNDYFNRRIPWVTSATDPGTYSDWVEITPDTEDELLRLINHVRAGKPALVSDAGHIAVIRPEQPDIQSWEELIIAQAGASNFLYGPLKGHFFGTPQFFIRE